MTIQNSSSIVTDGLVFYMDAGSKKSWIGPPVTNILPNKDFTTGWTFTSSSYNSSTQKLSALDTTSSTKYCYIDSSVVSGTTYTQSVLAKKSELSVLQITPSTGFAGYATLNYVNFDLASGVMYGTATGSAKMEYLGDGWYRCSYTDVADVTGSGRFVLVLQQSYLAARTAVFGGAGFTGYGIFLSQPQLEASPFASPFVSASRANTESILDLSGNRTITASSLKYNANSTFSFNASDHRIVVSGLRSIANSSTWSAWIRCTNGSASTYNMFMGRYLPYFSFYSGNRLYFSNRINAIQQTISTSANLTSNVWYNATFTTSYDGANTTMKIYVNGVETVSGIYAGSQSQEGGTFDFVVGDGEVTNWYRFDGEVPVVKIYNRTLSAAEVMRNFGALRGRYGV